MRPRRHAIQTASGIVVRGTHPDDARNTCGESPYCIALARKVRGLTEVALPVGRADVATATDVYEVEPVTRWRQGARQAYAYAGMSGLHANLALFGAADYLPIYLRVRDKLPNLHLWVWHPELKWRLLTNRHEAAIRVKGA